MIHRFLCVHFRFTSNSGQPRSWRPGILGSSLAPVYLNAYIIVYLIHPLIHSWILENSSKVIALAVVISNCRENFGFGVKITPRSLVSSFVGNGTKPSEVLKPYVNVNPLSKVTWTKFKRLKGIPQHSDRLLTALTHNGIDLALYSRFSNQVSKGATGCPYFVSDHLYKSWKGVGQGQSTVGQPSISLIHQMLWIPLEPGSFSSLQLFRILSVCRLAVGVELCRTILRNSKKIERLMGPESDYPWNMTYRVAARAAQFLSYYSLWDGRMF